MTYRCLQCGFSMITDSVLTPEMIRKYHGWMKADDMSCPSCTRHILKNGSENGGRKNGKITLPYITEIGVLQDENTIKSEIDERTADDLKMRNGISDQSVVAEMIAKYTENNRLFGWTAEEILQMNIRP